MEDPIRTALCSFGMSGLVFHAPFLEINPGFTLYGVWERSKSLAKEKYPEVKTFRTLDAMLADDAVELVIVNTPNYTHYEFAKKALEAGKHVIVEKPFTVHEAAADELIELAKGKGKKLSVYQNRRYDSDFKIMKKVLAEGLLGEVVEAEMRFDRYREGLSPKTHKEEAIAGSGVLYDLGSHLIDQALQLFGRPHKIFADIRMVRPQSKIDDYFELLLYYEKLRVRLKSTYLAREHGPEYILHGLKGSFIKPRTNIQEILLTGGTVPVGKEWGAEPESERGLLHTEKDGAVIREYLIAENGNYNEYYQKIYEAIRHDALLPVTAEQGKDVIHLIEKAIVSNQQQQVTDTGW